MCISWRAQDFTGSPREGRGARMEPRDRGCTLFTGEREGQEPQREDQEELP